MAKVNVKIIDQYTLELESDAKKGDVIDLKEITSIDTHILLKKINDQTDDIYQTKLKEQEILLKLEMERNFKQQESALKEETQLLKQKIAELNNQNKYSLDAKENEFKLKYEALKKDYTYQIEKQTTALNHELSIIKESTINEQKDLYLKETAELKTKIQALEGKNKQDLLEKDLYYKDQINNLTQTQKTLEFDYTRKLSELTQSYKDQLLNKDQEIDVLKREKSTLNVKKIGENLEKWCDQEFQSQSLAHLDFIVWEKDNEIIKNSKADFTYKVYADQDKKPDELLASAVLEMKSEDPTSTNHQSNQKFFKKLNDDRNNKGLEYAILVSELEWDTTNDAPIKKVAEYDKMYLIRPQYFIIFLNIITTFGLKYKEIFLNKRDESLKFKDSTEILNEFEAMKNEILDNALKNIIKHIELIITQSESITKANQKLLESAQTILNRHLVTIENKLNDFKIKRITSKIEHLNN